MENNSLKNLLKSLKIRTFGVRRSAFSVQRSAFSVQRSAFSVQRKLGLNNEKHIIKIHIGEIFLRCGFFVFK